MARDRRARLLGLTGVAAGAAALVCFCSAGSATAEVAVRDHVEKTLHEVLAVLGDRSLDVATRKARIEEIAFTQFDFNTMSRLVLARNWKRFSEQQQDDFITEFKVLLSRSYGNRLDRFGDESIEVTGEQAEPRGDVTVRTRIAGGEFDGAQIDYRMRKANEHWRAIDVVIEGVSLVSNYRAQFGEVVSKKGPAGLLGQMRKKNAAPAEAEAATDAPATE
jgi:phospholipid transport system substrate-binding protein